jgi:hypothetical protein
VSHSLTGSMTQHRVAKGPSPTTNPVDAVFEMATDAAEAARTFLVSEQGRRLRHQVATAIIIGAPIISELPLVRRSPVARFLRTAAVGTLVIRGAEWLRDWEPQPRLGDQPGV